MDFNQLRKKFEADEAYVPLGAWDRLESALDKKEPRSPIAWWLGAVLLFLGTGIGVSLYTNLGSSTIAQTEATTSTKGIPAPSASSESRTNQQVAIATSASNANSSDAQQPDETKSDKESGKQNTNPNIPVKTPQSGSNASNNGNSKTNASNAKQPDLPDYVRNNPGQNQANQTTRRNRTITTLIGARPRNRVLSIPNEGNTAVDRPTPTSNQLALNNNNGATTTVTRGGTNPNTNTVSTPVVTNPADDNGGNNNNSNNRRVSNNGNTPSITTPNSNTIAIANGNDQGNNGANNTIDNGANTSSNSGLVNGENPGTDNPITSTTPVLKTDSALATSTLVKPDSAKTAVNKPAESPKQTIARFSLWTELNMGNSPQTRISPNTNDGVLMQGAQINNQWQPSIIQGSLSVRYLLRPSVQIIGGILWQYEQLSYSRNIATHNQLESRAMTFDGNMVSNYAPVYQGHNGNITRHFVGLQTGANFIVLPRLELSGLIQLPLTTTGTEGNTSALRSWQAGMHYGLTPKIQLGAFWQQSFGTTLKMVDGTTITRSYAGISIRYRLK